MVQEARLDLIAPLAAALVLLGAAPAYAQNLLPDQPLLSSPPLTTLLQPQRLDRSKPLLPQDVARTPATPCQRVTAGAGMPAPASAASPGRAATGGSGPGEYGRYMPGAAASGTLPTDSPAKPGGTRSAAPADKPVTPGAGTSAPSRGADKPLYGGIDRPLWNTGEQRAPSNGAATPGEGAGSAALSPDAPVAIPRDRPLWNDGTPVQPGAPLTGAAAVAAAGLGLSPCSSAPAPLLR